MISDERAKELIIESLKRVKNSDPSYKGIKLSDSAVVLGDGGFLDSIAFTAFAVDFEERMERELEREYTLDVSEILALKTEKNRLTVSSMAAHVAVLAAKKQKKGAR